MIRVLIADDVSLCARRAHEAALACLPQTFRLVEARPADVIVSAAPTAGAKANVLTDIGKSSVGDRVDRDRGVFYDVPVYWDGVVQDLVEALRAAGGPIRAGSITATVDDERHAGSAVIAVLWLAGLIDPAVAPPSPMPKARGRVTALTLRSSASTLHVSVVVSSASRPGIALSVAGNGASAVAFLETGVTARPSTATVSGAHGSKHLVGDYSSPRRALWKAVSEHLDAG